LIEVDFKQSNKWVIKLYCICYYQCNSKFNRTGHFMIVMHSWIKINKDEGHSSVHHQKVPSRGDQQLPGDK